MSLQDYFQELSRQIHKIDSLFERCSHRELQLDAALDHAFDDTVNFEKVEVLMDKIRRAKTTYQKELILLLPEIKKMMDLNQLDDRKQLFLRDTLSRWHHASTFGSKAVPLPPAPASRIPAATQNSRIPAATSIPATKLPATSKAVAKEPEAVQNLDEPVSSRLPAPSRMPASSRMPAPSRMPVPSRLPQLNPAAKVQEDIQKHKMKRQLAQVIKQKGSLGNLKHASELKQMPRQIQQQEVLERIEGHKAMLESSKVVGMIKKSAARPAPRTAFGTSAEARAEEVRNLKIKHASAQHKQQLNKQREIGFQQLTMKQADQAPPEKSLLLLNVDPNMTPKSREENEREELKDLKVSTISKLCQLYQAHKKGDLSADEESREKAKMLQQMSKEIKTYFEMKRMYMTKYRGSSYRDDAPANNLLTQRILDYFDSDPSPRECKGNLQKFFKEMPQPKFKLESEVKSQETVTPLSSLKRPPSVGRIQKSFLRRRSRSASPADVILKEVKRLQTFKEKERTEGWTVRQKLDNFTSNFCKIFLGNHKRNRLSGYEIWRAEFMEHLDDILDDLEEFYNSLPHADGKSFNRKKVEIQFERFLYNLFKSTEKHPMTSDDCKEIVDRKFQASAEVGRLKNLDRILLVFVEQIDAILNPLVAGAEDFQRSEEKLSQKSRSKTPEKPSGAPQRPQTSAEKPSEREKTTARPQTSRKGKRSLKEPRRMQHVPEVIPENRKMTRLDVLKAEDWAYSPPRKTPPAVATSTPYTPKEWREQLHREVSQMQAQKQQPEVMQPEVKQQEAKQSEKKQPEVIQPENRKRWNLAPGSSEKIKRADIIITSPNRAIREQVEAALRQINVQVEINEVYDEVQAHLGRILDMWRELERNFCQALTDVNMVNVEREDAIYQPIRALKEEFIDILYGGNDERYPREIEAIDADFTKLKTRLLFQQLNNQSISKADCDAILDGRFEAANLPPDDIRRELVSFIKRLKDFKAKYIMKIVEGDPQGHLQPKIYEQRPAKSPIPAKEKQDSPLDSSDDDYERRMLTKAAPKAVVSKVKVPILRPLRWIDGPSTSQAAFGAPKAPPTIAPFRYTEGLAIPESVIARDILYVACQLTDRNDEDLPTTNAGLVREILKIAKNFKASLYTQRKALEAINTIFFTLSCVPVEFFKTFIYHPNNTLFDAIEFEDPHFNSAIRARLMEREEMYTCADESIPEHDQPSMNLVEYFHHQADDKANNLADNLEMLNSGKIKPQVELKELVGEVLIGGSELANDESGCLLAVPTCITGMIPHEVNAGNEKMFYLKTGNIPKANVASGLIEAAMKIVDAVLTKQATEVDHYENSRIYKNGLRYVLQPTAMGRQNFWQARGSDTPKWFPGFYTVYQNSFKLKPTLQSSPSSVLLHAWRSMAPLVDTGARGRK